MKKKLHLVSILLLLYPSILSAQLWPFGFPIPTCSYINGPTPLNPRCTKWPVINNGEWDVASTWNGGTVPAHNDIVCIPATWTVIVKGATYTPETSGQCGVNTAVSPKLYIFVCGTIDFDPSGKLYLGCGSIINVYTSGRVLGTNGSSDLIQIGPTVVWGGPGTGQQGNITGPYTITGGGQGAGVLPVNLLDFKAQLKRPFEVTVDWSTASETNSLEFIVERSADQKNWGSITTVKAKGNSGETVNYSFTDQSPAAGINYYRLKLVDANGNFVYSSIARITNRTIGKVMVYPNPVSATATLFSSEAFTKSQSIKILNSNGVLVQTISITGSNTLQFPTSKLAAGLYLVRIIENGKTVSETKLIKQ